MEGTDIVRCGVINSDLFYSKPEESDVQSGLCQPRLVQLELRKLLAESVNIVVVVGSTTTASFGSTLGRRFLLASCLFLATVSLDAADLYQHRIWFHFSL